MHVVARSAGNAGHEASDDPGTGRIHRRHAGEIELRDAIALACEAIELLCHRFRGFVPPGAREDIASPTGTFGQFDIGGKLAGGLRHVVSVFLICDRIIP